MDNTIFLALGAIFNDGNNQVNSGHVQVYKCAFSAFNGWDQVGRDIDDDNGVILDGDAFHVGDVCLTLDWMERCEWSSAFLEQYKCRLAKPSQLDNFLVIIESYVDHLDYDAFVGVGDLLDY